MSSSRIMFLKCGRRKNLQVKPILRFVLPNTWVRSLNVPRLDCLWTQLNWIMINILCLFWAAECRGARGVRNGASIKAVLHMSELIPPLWCNRGEGRKFSLPLLATARKSFSELNIATNVSGRRREMCGEINAPHEQNRSQLSSWKENPEVKFHSVLSQWLILKIMS